LRRSHWRTGGLCRATLTITASPAWGTHPKSTWASSRAMRSQPESVNLEPRRWYPRSPMPFSRSPENASGRCRLAGRNWC